MVTVATLKIKNKGANPLMPWVGKPNGGILFKKTQTEVKINCYLISFHLLEKFLGLFVAG